MKLINLYHVIYNELTYFNSKLIEYSLHSEILADRSNLVIDIKIIDFLSFPFLHHYF